MPILATDTVTLSMLQCCNVSGELAVALAEPVFATHGLHVHMSTRRLYCICFPGEGIHPIRMPSSLKVLKKIHNSKGERSEMVILGLLPILAYHELLPAAQIISITSPNPGVLISRRLARWTFARPQNIQKTKLDWNLRI